MKLIAHAELNDLVLRAKLSHRNRQHANLHDDDVDPCQRLFNAIGVDSYIQPHRHSRDPRTETLLAVRGSFALVLFDDDGNICDVSGFAAGTGVSGAGAIGAIVGPQDWHTVLALEQGSVLIEIKSGPFNPRAAKEAAPWSVVEGSAEAVAYFRWLRHKVLVETRD